MSKEVPNFESKKKHQLEIIETKIHYRFIRETYFVIL